MNISQPELIDSSLFLGMHSINEETRIVCKNYFVERLQTTISMSLEHVGGCDNIIWLYPRELQDAYYPFMDTLHTIMNIKRLPYEENDIKIALTDSELQALPMYDRLLIGFAKNRKKIVYTVNKKLIDSGKLPVFNPPISQEKSFPESLEKLYQVSLQLKIPDIELTSDYYNNSDS
ncbi:DUF6190 family protein [Desmonostoc muscorum LEGE 12446]|uniref:Uncharacterized protein n=1 Tax=Desmonostoc muscorum LEGE 12446 TaxID=1828758 RepID=A0A8J6ZNR0_DESMC|nr:DUF6190 family protein [Desmonostoc muscorum]MCF2149643.1 DUF6190 family protein [Desmonostoc muscorum LEGE 12446]